MQLTVILALFMQTRMHSQFDLKAQACLRDLNGQLTGWQKSCKHQLATDKVKALNSPATRASS
jgi:hypothetical protein